MRVDPAGGGTDVPPFSLEHGGKVVNFAVQRHAYASVERLPEGSGVTIYSEDLAAGVHASSVAQLPGQQFEFLEGFVRRLAPADASLLLVTETDVPAGSGLGGSGALGVAVAAALQSAFGELPPAQDIARLANEIERQDLGYAGGDQDSYGAALGGVLHLSYPKGAPTNAERIELDTSTRLSLEHRSLLIFTGEAHVSGDIHADIQRAYRVENSPTLAAMFELRSAAERMAEALRTGDLAAYAEALNASRENLYRLHPSCDCEAHRRCFAALEDVIDAGKTCGAGGGGFILAFTKPGRRIEATRIARKLDARVWPVNIDFEGVRTWEAAASTARELERYRRLTTS